MDLFSDWATVYIHWPILIELYNHLQLNWKLLTGGWPTTTHLFAQHNPMLCWPMSILGPNSVLIDSSHCWWMPWWVQASKPACFSLMCQMSIDRSPPASLNIKMLTPKPHLSHFSLIYSQQHKHTYAQHPKPSNACEILLSQQSKVNHRGRKQQIVYWCDTPFEALQRGKHNMGLDGSKITHMLMQQQYKDGHVLMFVKWSEWRFFSPF